MSSQVKKFSQCELRDKKHQHSSIVSLPTDSVILDHAVFSRCSGIQYFWLHIPVSIKEYRIIGRGHTAGRVKPP
jgi:hypothetical protein